MAAINAGIAAWRGADGREVARRELAGYYDLLSAYYQNDSTVVYSPGRLDALRAQDRALYTYTRLLFNPTRPVVAFYKDHLYPATPQILGSGAALATPVQDGADDDLLEAIAQIDQWTNWQAESLRAVEMWASLGEGFIEVQDELDREKVTHKIVEPKYVYEVEADAAGNVKAYTLQYKVYDPVKKEYYEFRKEVDDEEFRYFRAGKPFDPPGRAQKPGGADGYRYNDADEGARKSVGVYENPYGFAPAVWAKHLDMGKYGLPAVWNFEKIDEINSLASHQHDRTHKGIEGAKVLTTDGDILSVTGAAGASKRNEEGGLTTYDTRSDWMLLKMSANSGTHDLDSGFDPTKADPQIVRLYDSFVSDYPELQAAKLIAEHGATSGEALKFKLGRAQAKLDQAGANMNQQIVKLKQMSVAIAGWRFNGGGWTKRDAQQEKFSPFNLDSYAAGALDFGLRRSLLVQETENEKIERQGKQLDNARKARDVFGFGEKVLEIAGVTDEKERREMLTAKQADDAANDVNAIAARIAAGAQNVERVQ